MVTSDFDIIGAETGLWKARVAQALEAEGAENAAEQVSAETPPDSALGDLGFPMFRFAKPLRKGPPQIAKALEERLKTAGYQNAKAVGPYLNVFLDRSAVTASVLEAALRRTDEFLHSNLLAGERIMVEFSSPNTNKPLHLGHLRNDALGESISHILAAAGAAVRKVCIVNDRGVHICKSMLAYQKFFAPKTPESEGVKSDRFVGDCYVRFSKWQKEEDEKKAAPPPPQAENAADRAAQEMLRKWEAGDTETRALWKTMNSWALSGMKETYQRTGVGFDAYYFESDTYLRGREEVLKGLERGLFYRDTDGAVKVDLSADGLGDGKDKGIKTLLRGDGTSIYITQDFGTALLRHEDWPFTRLVYVVGNEQQHHFKVLFTLLCKLGFEWAGNLHHLSYGMVNLPSGKMKSREGTVVDADDLLDALRDMALAEIRGKEREEAVGDAKEVAEKIALAALHYYLLQVSPERDMMYNPEESLSFNGNTGPYMQYMGARLSSMFRKAGDSCEVPADLGFPSLNTALISSDAEWALVRAVAAYRASLEEAASKYDPSLLCAWVYSLSTAFSRFYHDCPILSAENPALREARLALCRATLIVLREALRLLCIPFVESM